MKESKLHEGYTVKPGMCCVRRYRRHPYTVHICALNINSHLQ